MQISTLYLRAWCKVKNLFLFLQTMGRKNVAQLSQLSQPFQFYGCHVSSSPCKGCRDLRDPLLQQSPVIIVFQYLHLLNGNTVEFNEPLPLWHSIIDEYSIDILHI